jgi:hypothetical protein
VDRNLAFAAECQHNKGNGLVRLPDDGTQGAPVD